MILGCALFYELLKPAATLCKILQFDEVCVVDAIEAILKTSKTIEKLKTTTFEKLPTVKKVLSRVEHTHETTYQGAKIVKYEEGVSYLKSRKNGLMESVLACLKDRVKVQHPELLTHTLTLLVPQGWNRSGDGDFADSALEELCLQFATPLDKAGVDISLWKLFNSPDSKKWSNILALIELLFCLPMANGCVERIFSSLKLIKSNRRNCLSENRLDDLLRIAVDGPDHPCLSGMPVERLSCGGTRNRGGK